MTKPLAQGTSTWARTTRLADLEWAMSRKKVLAMFASARTYPRHEARNPSTGEPVVVRESVALEATAPPVPEVAVHGSVAFDDKDGLDSITLKSTFPRPADATDDALLRAANKVLAALGLEPLPALPSQPKTWKRAATAVAFDRDDECFWFELSPG